MSGAGMGNVYPVCAGIHLTATRSKYIGVLEQRRDIYAVIRNYFSACFTKLCVL